MLKLFPFITTKRRLKKHKRTCEDHDFCHVNIPNEDNKILKYNHGEKSLQVSFIMYADLKCLVGKIDTCQNNNGNSYTEKKAKHTPSGYLLVTWCSFDESKIEVSYYRGKDCIEMFTKKIKEQAMKIIK